MHPMLVQTISWFEVIAISRKKKQMRFFALLQNKLQIIDFELFKSFELIHVRECFAINQ
jgi:hypothetical protein